MKKIITKPIFFVETILFFISVHLVPFFKEKRFASKLILANDFFKKNIISKTTFFAKTAVFIVSVQIVPVLKKLCFTSNFIQQQKFSVIKVDFFVRKSVFLMVGLFFVPSLLLAQSSEFIISTQIVDDLIPPTTPTMLSVLPVAFDQIDVEWSVSTDNFMLGGYVLLRDGTPIATTTLTTYIDTGLTASTTYSYEVYAFDTFYSISTSSNALATTTLEAPIIPPAPTSTTPTDTTGTRVLRLDNLEITSLPNSAIFWWQTNVPARYALRWGRNDAYDDGYILNDVYRKEHQTLVSDLEPGTFYLYELIGYGNNGIAITLKQGQFKTEDRETLVPPNVQNLRAIVEENDVNLSFTTPASVDLLKIRIVRSHLGYPVDPYDGAVIYEGGASSFFDKGALKDYGSQYYTLFVIAEDGSISSGAVVKAKRKIINTATGTESEGEEPFEQELIEILDFGFSVENIGISQGDVYFNFKSQRIILSENNAFVISIPVDSLPKNLKSIIVTLLDPTNQTRSYSFLLRINKNRTAYEATISPIGLSGVSRLQIEIYDYEREIIGRYRKQIDFVSTPEVQVEVVFPDKLIKVIQPIFSTFSLIFLTILLILFLLYRRLKHNEDNR